MFSRPLKSLSLTVAAVTGSFCIASMALSTAAMANGADIINGWIEGSKTSQTFQLVADKVAYDAGSDVVTANNLALTISINPKNFGFKQKLEGAKKTKDFVLYFKLPMVKFTQLSKNATHYSVKKVASPLVELAFEMDAAKQNIASVGTYTNLLATDLSWAKPPALIDDPAKPVSKFFPAVKAWTDISFSVVKVDKMEMVQQSQEPNMVSKTTYNEIIYKNASHGNIALTTAKSLVVDTTGEPFSYRVNVGPTKIVDYNLGVIIDNFSPDIMPQENAPYKTAIKEMSVGKVDVTFKKGIVSIDQMTWNDIGVRVAPVSFLLTLDRFIPQISANQEPNPQAISDLIRSSYGAFRIGRSEVKGVKFDVDGVVGKLANISLNDFSSDGLGAQIFSDFSIKMENEFDVSFAKINIKGIKFPAINDILNLEKAQKTNDIMAMLKAMPILGELSADDVRVDIASKGIFSFAHAGYTMSGHIGPIPTNITTKLTDLNLPVSMLDRGARQPLSAMGYKTINLSYNDNIKWDAGTESLGIKSSLNLVDGGAYQFAATLGKIPKLLFDAPMAAPGLLIGATFNQASFNFDDKSIVDRAFKYFAAKEKMDETTLRQMTLAGISASLDELKNPEFTKSVVDAVTTFFKNKGSIRASAKPSTPVPLVDVYSIFGTAPQTLVDKLNIQVQAR